MGSALQRTLGSAFLFGLLASSAQAQGGAELQPPPRAPSEETSSPDAAAPSADGSSHAAPAADASPGADQPATGADDGAPETESTAIGGADTTAPPAQTERQLQPTPFVAPTGDRAPAPLPPPGYGDQRRRTNPAPTPSFAPSYAPRRRRGRVRYVEGMELPVGAQLVERRRRGLLVPGIAVFAGVYGVSVALAIADRDAILAVPLAGPVLWQLRYGNADTAPGAAVASIAQLAGVVLFALGMRKRTYVEYGTTARRRVRLIPTLHTSYAGLTLDVR
ncbi:MAG: hypothetical protein AAF411_26550 [Myxococcota bacterium]